jgi:hypothetical protein
MDRTGRQGWLCGTGAPAQELCDALQPVRRHMGRHAWALRSQGIVVDVVGGWAQVAMTCHESWRRATAPASRRGRHQRPTLLGGG